MSLSLFNLTNYSKNKKNKNSLSTGKNKKSLDTSDNLNSPFHKETPLCTCKQQKIKDSGTKASLTVEAAVVFPLLACFLVSILFFFKVMEMQIDVTHALQYAARNTAVISADERFDKPVYLMSNASVLFEATLEKLKSPKKFTSSGIILLNYLKSDTKGDYVDLYTTYRMKLPFGIFGNQGVWVEQRAKARKWTGYKETTQDETSDPWVYITETGSVYHTTQDCTYLKLSIKEVSKNDLDDLRNKSGGIYHKCSFCKNFGTTVYVTDYGTTYHSSLNCKGLKRTIYKVRKSEVKDYKPCSKCAKGE